MKPLVLTAVALLTFSAGASADDAALIRYRNEQSAIRGLKTLSAAQALFREGDKDSNGEYDYADSMAALGKPKLISVEFATGTLSGYRFAIRRHPKQPELQWMVIATPATPASGTRSFAMNHKAQVLHALKPFALQDDCQPTGVPLTSPLSGWSAPTTALGALFKAVDPALNKHYRRGFTRYLVPADKSAVTYSEVRFASDLRVETYLIERGGATTVRRFHLSPEGFLVYAAILRGKLTDRKQPEATWELKPGGKGFLVTHAGKTTPFAASPSALPRDVLIHLLPHLLLESKTAAFAALLLTMDLKGGFGAPKGEARLALDPSKKRVGGSATEVAYQFSHSTQPAATAWIGTTGPDRHQIKALRTGAQRLSFVPQSKGVGILKGFLPKGTINKTRKVAVARMQITALKVALASYKSDMGRYPRLTPRPRGTPASTQLAMGDDAPALFAALLNKPTLEAGGGQNSPYLDSWKHVGVLKARSWLAASKIGNGARPLTREEAGRRTSLQFQRLHAPTSPTPLVLLDPWGNPYHYREWASCRSSHKGAIRNAPVKRTVTVGGKTKTVPDQPHNSESFDIWSNGPNGINEYGAPGSDDVASWRRR